MHFDGGSIFFCSWIWKVGGVRGISCELKDNTNSMYLRIRLLEICAIAFMFYLRLRLRFSPEVREKHIETEYRGGFTHE